MNNSSVFRNHLIALCEKLKLPLKHRDSSEWEWDGTTLSTNTSDCVLAHNIAHWVICPSERRAIPEFGLGAPPHGKSAERVVSISESGKEEELASLLGIAIEAFYGHDFNKTLQEHQWDEYSDRLFWHTVYELNKMNLLVGHIPIFVL